MRRFDGGDIYLSDVRTNNLHNIYWSTREGQLVSLTQMTDEHLRNVALMLIGMGYQAYRCPQRLRVLWLSALRLEWERRRQAK